MRKPYKHKYRVVQHENRISARVLGESRKLHIRILATKTMGTYISDVLSQQFVVVPYSNIRKLTERTCFLIITVTKNA